MQNTSFVFDNSLGECVEHFIEISRFPFARVSRLVTGGQNSLMDVC